MPKVLVPLLGLVLASCGLEDIKYLENPSVPDPVAQTKDGEGFLIFSAPQSYFAANSGFLGYDIYYKIQNPSGGSNLTSDTAKLRAEAPNTAAELQSNGYRLISPGRPTIEIGGTRQTEDWKVVIDFSSFILATQDEKKNNTAWAYLIHQTLYSETDYTLGLEESIELKRSVQATDNEIKTFGNLFSPTEASLPALEPGLLELLTAGPPTGMTIEITFFLVAYGVDPVNPVTTIESEPVPLGTLGKGSGTFIIR